MCRSFLTLQKIQLVCWGIFSCFLLACGQEALNPTKDSGAMDAAPPEITDHQPSPSFFDFTLENIDGKPVPLKTFKGKVLLVVNTASFCGNTPQYEGLQTLYHQFKAQGFDILAFPANDFGRQEPGSNEEIADFCYTKYGIDFSLFSKIVVKGPNKHPLYRFLTEQSSFKGEVSWNFQKYVLDRKGQVIARFRPGVNPLSPDIIDNIQQALSRV